MIQFILVRTGGDALKKRPIFGGPILVGERFLFLFQTFFFNYFLNKISFIFLFFFPFFELILRNWQLTNIQLDSWLMVSCVPKEMFSFPWPWVWVPLISIIVIYISHKSKQNLSHFFFFFFFGPRKMNAYHAILWLMHVCCSKKKKNDDEIHIQMTHIDF